MNNDPSEKMFCGAKNVAGELQSFPRSPSPRCSRRSSRASPPRQEVSSQELPDFTRPDRPAFPHHRGLSSPNRTRLREKAGNSTYPPRFGT